MRLKTSLSLAQQLVLGFASVLVLLCVVAASNAVTLRSVSASMKQIVNVNNGNVELAHALLSSIDEMSIRARAIMLATESRQVDDESKKMNAAQERYERVQTQLLEALQAASERERQLFAAIAEAHKRAMPLIRQAMKHGVEGNNFAAVKEMEKAQPDEEAWRKTVADFIELQKTLNGQSAAATEFAQLRAILLSAALAAIAVAMGSLIAWRVVRGVTRPIRSAVEVSERIAQGDLTSDVAVTHMDETGRLLQAIAAMQQRLRSLVAEIQQTADSVQRASHEMAAGNEDLSTRTERAASRLQQTAASMEQLTGTVRDSAASAQQANQLASSAASVAARGGQVVSQVVSTMQDINASSKRIADIIGVIDGIAFQTNILALNAAVEAARAGEQGRGFAVVAGEVRSLAQRSAEAAKEIKALIGASVDKVESGSKLVQDAGTTMNEIVASVERVNEIIGRIAVSSATQSDGITEVNAAVTQLDQMTQQNASLVEQGAAAADSLKEQAGRLSSIVGTFQVTV